jgi:hypothetical protein
MITNYIRPQLLIRQLLEVLPAVTEPSIHAFVYGPQFNLHRYTKEDERGAGVEFTTGAMQLAYSRDTKGENVELGYTRLFAEDMEVNLAEFDDNANNGRFFYNHVSRPNEIVLKDQQGVEINVGDAANPQDPLHTNLSGRAVQIGDMVIVEDASANTKTRRAVVDIAKSTEDSSIGDAACVSIQETVANDLDKDVESVFGAATITASNVNVTNDGSAAAKFATVGSNFGNTLAERFTVFGTKKAAGTVKGEARVRTVSDSFENDEVEVNISGGDTVIVLPDTGLTLKITGLSEWNIGDAVSFTTELTHTPIDCQPISGGLGIAGNVQVSGNYSHKQDTSIIIECVKGGLAANAEWAVSDSNGLEDALTISGTALETGTSIGMTGVQVTVANFYSNLHRAGDSITIPCVAAGRTGLYSVLVLNAPAGDPTAYGNLSSAPLNVEIRKVYSGEISKRGATPPDDQWTATEDGVTIPSGLALLENSFPTPKFVFFQDGKPGASKLFVHYREIVPAVPNEKIVRISKPSQLEQFGQKDIENPLGFGATAALGGANGKPIYIGRVASDDLAGFRDVLRKAENMDFLYGHAPLTDDYEIQLAVRDHVDLMSNEFNKKWRRAYISTPVPGDYRVLGYEEDGTPYTGTITNDGSGNVVLHDADGKFIQAKVKHGDLIRINFSSDAWGDPTFDNWGDGGYLVHEVLDEETIILASGPAKPLSIPRRYEVWKKDTAGNIAIFAASRSSSISSRRVNNVFVDGAQYLTDDSEFVTLNPMYLACEIAGLRCSVLPQQGLTNTEIGLVSSAEAMFAKYSQEDLDLIAANGSFIITQEYEDGPRFIRHQLTTKSDLGNLYYEDSVGVNIDEISFAVKGRLRPYIGRRNVNPQTISEIFNDMYGLLADYTTDPGFGNSIGPALIGFTDLVIGINEVYKDRIDVSAKLEVPLPLNVIDATLHATASFNEGELTLESFGISRVGTTVDNLTTALFDSEGNVVSVGYELPLNTADNA